MDERSLGDPPAPSEDEPQITASEYAAGIRPGRARVKIRHNLHLYPRLQEVAEQIETAPDDEVDALVDEFESLRDRMETVFVLERRSAEWVREAGKRLRNEMDLPKNGVKDLVALVPGEEPGSMVSKVSHEQMLELGQRMVAEQIVEPDGFTWENLRDLTEAGAVDVNGRRIDDALAVAMQELNGGRYEALTLDFSQRRSTTRRKRRSSTR